MLVNCGAGNFKILMISRIENANSCLELLHLALKRRALKGHCGDLGWEKMAFLGEGRQTGICHLVIATLAPLTRKPPFFAFFRGSQVYGLGAKKARLKSKQRLTIHVSLHRQCTYYVPGRTGANCSAEPGLDSEPARGWGEEQQDLSPALGQLRSQSGCGQGSELDPS